MSNKTEEASKARLHTSSNNIILGLSFLSAGCREKIHEQLRSQNHASHLFNKRHTSVYKIK